MHERHGRPDMKILTIPLGPIGSNSYLAVSGDEAVLVDPSVGFARIAALFPDGAPPRIEMIFATHGHYDHIAEADSLRDATGAALGIHRLDAVSLQDSFLNASWTFDGPMTFRPADRILEEGDSFRIFDDAEIVVLHTPGHSPGSSCLLLREAGKDIALFTGDTLFRGTAGRTDFCGDPALMAASLRRLGHLDESLAILPGHGEPSTIGREKLRNPFLRRAMRQESPDA